ncbi:MAG: LysM domain-containing protein [Myxococcota bacterium]
MTLRFFMRALLTVLALVLTIGALSEPQPAKAQEIVNRTPFNPKVDTYTVQSGDTLWSISRRVVGSPWVWPRVWSFNPEIANPNWIYPGDVIYFYERDFSFPSLYDRPSLASKDVELEKDEVGSAEAESAPELEVIRAKPRVRRRSGRQLVNMFITESELEEAGTLVNAADDDLLLSTYDTVYLEFPQEKVPSRGDDYVVYRTVQRVKHPIRGGNFGYITEVTAFAKVKAPRDDGIVSAELYDATLETERGYLVAPKTSDLRDPVKSVPAKGVVEGVVVAVNNGAGVVGSELQLAFVDVGTGAGIERGNELVVYRRSDRYRDSGRRDDLPLRPIGLLRVVDAKETASTVMILDSIEEIEAGLKVRSKTN